MVDARLYEEGGYGEGDDGGYVLEHLADETAFVFEKLKRGED